MHPGPYTHWCDNAIIDLMLSQQLKFAICLCTRRCVQNLQPECNIESGQSDNRAMHLLTLTAVPDVAPFLEEAAASAWGFTPFSLAARGDAMLPPPRRPTSNCTIKC